MKQHLINENSTIQEAIKRLDELGLDAILFVHDENNFLLGSISDGDVRRGLIVGKSLETKVAEIMCEAPRSLKIGDIDVSKLKNHRAEGLKLIPLIDEKNKIHEIMNFRITKSILPINVLIMAGGKGSRLLPLTENTPKPMLKIGDKPILEHTIERLKLFSINEVTISVNYLSDVIKDYFGNGIDFGIKINYIEETNRLGSIGALSLFNNPKHDITLVINSDILTTIDFEDFYLDFIKNEADFSAVGIPYTIDVPYGIFNLNKNIIEGVEEKPTFSYYSNGGIYLVKSSLINLLPINKPFYATDYISKLINHNKKVISYFTLDYWLDIGSHADYKKAMEDIKKIEQ